MIRNRIFFLIRDASILEGQVILFTLPGTGWPVVTLGNRFPDRANQSQSYPDRIPLLHLRLYSILSFLTTTRILRDGAKQHHH
jgi:hypothetical protein